MKKLISVLCIALVVFTTGCSMEYKKNTEKISIVTTIFAAYDFAKQVSGDMADVKMLLKPGAESHSYEPTPKDIIEIENCDVFIYTGGENDEWVTRILSNAKNPNMKVIKMLDLVEKYEEEIVEGMEHHEEDSDEEEWDEHVWTDPCNAAIIAENIKNTLCEADSANRESYENNFNNYKDELNALHTEIQTVVDNATKKEVVFGDRFPLRYFVERYGLKYFAAFPGCASETEPSAKTIVFLIDKAREEQIPVVFTIELSNGNIAKTIAKESNAKVMTFYTCHNVTKTDFENGETYISLMKKNLETLKEALY